jgi:uncharacterized protein (UPF0254 family)
MRFTRSANEIARSPDGVPEEEDLSGASVMTTDVPQRTHGGKGVGTNAGYLQGYILGTIAIF